MPIVPFDFRQGDDVVVKLPIVDSSENPIDISQLIHAVVALYVDNNRYADFTFEENPPTGYGEAFLAAGDDTNVLSLMLTREMSALIAPGAVVARAMIVLPPVETYPPGMDGEQATEYEINVGNCIIGFLKEDEIPSVATAPTLVTAETDSSGDYVVLTFSEDMSKVIEGTEFTISVLPATLNPVVYASVNHEVVALELTNPILNGEDVLLDYDKDVAPVLSALGGLLDTIVEQVVTNNVPA